MTYVTSKTDGLVDLLVESSQLTRGSIWAEQIINLIRMLDLDSIIGIESVPPIGNRKIPTTEMNMAVFDLAVAYVARANELSEDDSAIFTSFLKHQEHSLAFELAQIRYLFDLMDMLKLDGVPLRVEADYEDHHDLSLPVFDFTDSRSLESLIIDGQPATAVSVSELRSPAYLEKLQSAFVRSDSIFFTTNKEEARRGVYSLFGAAIETAASLFKSSKATNAASSTSFNSVDFTLECQNAGEAVDWFFQARYSPKYFGTSTPIKKMVSPGLYKFEARKANGTTILDSGTYQIDQHNRYAKTISF